LDSLSGSDFEKLVCGLFERMGFQAEQTKATGDGGVDIILRVDRPIVGGRYLIQCKRYSKDSRIGEPVVREFYGAVAAQKGVIKGVFVTTSSFTEGAVKFAKSLPIELIDGVGLKTLIELYPANES
jgi:restriction system protein